MKKCLFWPFLKSWGGGGKKLWHPLFLAPRAAPDNYANFQFPKGSKSGYSRKFYIIKIHIICRWHINYQYNSQSKIYWIHSEVTMALTTIKESLQCIESEICYFILMQLIKRCSSLCILYRAPKNASLALGAGCWTKISFQLKILGRGSP